MNNKISHSGIVESVAGDSVRVRIVQTSACAACKVASHCNASEAKEKVVDVRHADAARLPHVGDAVVVWASAGVARRALLFGFGLPLVLMVVVLLVVLGLTGSEGMAAMGGLLALVPYYIVLWLCRDRMQERLAFHLETSI